MNYAVRKRKSWQWPAFAFSVGCSNLPRTGSPEPGSGTKWTVCFWEREKFGEHFPHFPISHISTPFHFAHFLAFSLSELRLDELMLSLRLVFPCLSFSSRPPSFPDSHFPKSSSLAQMNQTVRWARDKANQKETKCHPCLLKIWLQNLHFTFSLFSPFPLLPPTKKLLSPDK